MISCIIFPGTVEMKPDSIANANDGSGPSSFDIQTIRGYDTLVESGQAVGDRTIWYFLHGLISNSTSRRVCRSHIHRFSLSSATRNIHADQNPYTPIVCSQLLIVARSLTLYIYLLLSQYRGHLIYLVPSINFISLSLRSSVIDSIEVEWQNMILTKWITYLIR